MERETTPKGDDAHSFLSGWKLPSSAPLCTPLEQQQVTYPDVNSTSTSTSTANTELPTEFRPDAPFIYHGKNMECLVCKVDLHIGVEPIALLECSHAYHVRCGEGMLCRDSGDECPTCRPHSIEPGDDDDNRTDARTPVGRDEDFYRDEYGESGLSSRQRAVIAGWGVKQIFKTVTSRLKIDFEYCVENGVNADRLLTQAELGLLDLYFSVGIQKWEQLLKLGFRKEHVVDAETVDELMDLYYVDSVGLSDDLRFSLRDFAELGLNCGQLARLGLRFDVLMRLGLTCDELAPFKLDPRECAKGLGMTKKHAFRMELTGPRMRKLGWNPRIAAKVLDLNWLEMKELYIDDDDPPEVPPLEERPKLRPRLKPKPRLRAEPRTQYRPKQKVGEPGKTPIRRPPVSSVV